MEDENIENILPDTTPILYAGFPGPEEAKRANMGMAWKIYPATPEGIKQAIADGYQAKSIFEFSHPIDENGRNTVIRFGDLILDIDAKKEEINEVGEKKKVGDIETSLKAVKNFLRILTEIIHVDPNDLRYYASGGKGFHVIIPRGLLGSGDGDPQLPLIYRDVLEKIVAWENIKALHDNDEILNFTLKKALHDSKNAILGEFCIDVNGFKSGKGQLIRLPHIKRPNGNYKVPITYEEIMSKPASFFEGIVKEDRYLPIEDEPLCDKEAPRLAELYLKCKAQTDRFHDIAIGNLPEKLATILTKCKFVRFCREQPKDVSEPQWFCLASILKRFGDLGKKIFHAISKLDTERYNQEETEKKFNKNNCNVREPTCRTIANKGCCDGACGVQHPSDHYKKDKAQANICTMFGIKDDMLVYNDDFEENDNYTKVSSKIELKAMARDVKNENWSKVFIVTDMDGFEHECLISNEILSSCYSEEALKIVSNAGLMLEPGPKSKKLLTLFMQSAQTKNMARMCDKNGWTDESFTTYLPIDNRTINVKKEYVWSTIEESKPIFKKQGELIEWMKTIGRYCVGNDLLSAAVIMGLCGPCLPLCDIPNFGLHFYGSSSVGKTSLLRATASVTGGNVESWRTTDNALEGRALAHNHNTICLDEISQCDPEKVFEAIYMLGNGQSKGRSTKTGSQRPTKTWETVFVSSGENNITERINQGYKTKAMAGQEVRVVNILAEIEDSHGAFQTLPEGIKNGQEFSDAIGKAATQFTGAPLEAIVKCIKSDPKGIRDTIFVHFDKFMEKYEEMELSGQQKRVCKYMAFMAGVGEAAILKGILPWKIGSAFKSMCFVFDLWLKDKKGNMEIEIDECMKKIIQDACNGFFHHQPPLVYDFDDYIFLSRAFIEAKYCECRKYHKLKEALDKEGLLRYSPKTGEIMTQLSEYTKPRPRGIYLLKEKLFGYESANSSEVPQIQEFDLSNCEINALF